MPSPAASATSSSSRVRHASTEPGSAVIPRTPPPPPCLAHVAACGVGKLHHVLQGVGQCGGRRARWLRRRDGRTPARSRDNVQLVGSDPLRVANGGLVKRRVLKPCVREKPQH